MATIIGTDRGDNIVGTAGDDVIVTLGGNDVIDAGGGRDSICGNDGNDVIRAGAGDDTIDGGAGNDVVEGGDDTDRCVIADRDAVTMCETTAATMYALTGVTDTAPPSSTNPTPTTPAPTTPTPSGTACDGKVATISGTDRGDVITGTSGDDVIVALGGNDVIDGAGGNDTICSGPGRDQVLGGDGADVIDGGEGDDDLRGGPGDDRLSGGAGDDALAGDDGDDQLDGGAGRDALTGGTDDDLLIGAAGNDALKGGPGDDVLDGGTDRNSVWGEEDLDACTPANSTSTTQTCEGLAQLLTVSGGSLTFQGTTLTVPAGLLTTASYAAIRPEPAGERVTKTELLGTLSYVDLLADWEGRGAVTISMPFDATGRNFDGAERTIYRFGDDGAIETLDNIRVSADGSRAEFDTTALSAFTGGIRWPCNAVPAFIPSFCHEVQSLTPSKLKDKVVTRDSTAILLACGVGVGFAFLEPTPAGEAGVYLACLKAAVEQAATANMEDQEQAAVGCATGAAPLARRGGFVAAFGCASGIVQGPIVDTLSDLSCKALDCVTIDAKEAEYRAQVSGGSDGSGSNPGGGGNYNPQPPTVNPQPPTVNPQPPTVDPQPGGVNPQPPTVNPQG